MENAEYEKSSICNMIPCLFAKGHLSFLHTGQTSDKYVLHQNAYECPDIYDKEFAM